MTGVLELKGIMMPFNYDDEVMNMLHVRTRGLSDGDPIAEPLAPTSTFVLGENPDASQIYGRYGASNTGAAEQRLSMIDDAPVVLFSSGMATYTALILAVLKPGDKVLILDDGYSHARRLMEKVFFSYQIQMVVFSALEAETVSLDQISLTIVETPSNPNLDVIDVEKFCGRAAKASCLVVVDNTLCTGLLQRPSTLGADFILASDTKAPGGHSDLILGQVATRNADVYDKLREIRMFTGSIPGPYEAILLSRSLETLELRLERMCSSAEVIAELLNASPKLKTIRFPGLKSDPAYAVAQRQMKKPGFVIGATFPSADDANRFIAGSDFIVKATSFGGTHTSADRRARWGDDVGEGFLRISVGVEPITPMVEKIEQALAAL
ncbi:MAG: PLP-dependent transferase [Litoreibacter sp.]